MPTYAWQCSECGHSLERFERISPTPPARKCPDCHKQSLKRLIGGGIKTTLRDVSYPYYNFQLPLQPGQKPGEPNVMSRSHENDICAGLLGDRYERNAI